MSVLEQTPYPDCTDYDSSPQVRVGTTKIISPERKLAYDVADAIVVDALQYTFKRGRYAE